MGDDQRGGGMMGDWELHNTDCRLWLPTLADRSVDVVIVDPPYSEHVHGKQRRGGAALRGRVELRPLDFASLDPALMAVCAGEFARLARRWVAVFCDVESSSAWRLALVGAGLEYIRTGIWVKPGAAPQFTGDRPAPGYETIVLAHRAGRKRWNGGGSPAVWTYPIVTGTTSGRPARLHKTQKPLPLMRELVRLFSDPGELILDSFAGSGTTLVAALLEGRKAIGCELDAAYAAVARERLERTQPEGTAATLLFGLPLGAA